MSNEKEIIYPMSNEKSSMYTLKPITPIYGLITPTDDDFYDIQDHNANMLALEGALNGLTKSDVALTEQIKNLQVQINGIDVTTDVEEVTNRRVNSDTTKPLNTVISALIDGVKTLINDTKSALTTLINGLPQKSIWTDARGAKLDNLNQSLTTTQTNIINAINATGSIKSIQRGTVLCPGGGEATQSTTVSINTVNIAKCIVLLNGAWSSYTSGSLSMPYIATLTSTSLTMGRSGAASSSYSGQNISWQVIEFN